MNSIQLRLSIMMFLQYAIWGAWAPVLGKYLGDLGLPGHEIGYIFAVLPLATVLVPFITGQLADRYFATERLMAVLHILGGVAMIFMASAGDFPSIMLWMIVFSVFYAPTLALSNSICFANMRDSEREFGLIRVFGTIGWIAAGLMLSAWRSLMEGNIVTGDLLYVSGACALALGAFSFLLPHTPPKKEGANPLAFLEALALFKNRNFAVFMIISFIVGTELEFYYILTSPFLGELGVSDAKMPLVMTIAQVAEMFVMVLMLPMLLPKLGARKLLAFGVIAWPIRYMIFAIGGPLWLVVASLMLHGFCYVFFFVVGFIYVDKVAPPDIKASAQALVAIVVLGLGRFIGSIFAGWVQTYFTVDGVANWTNIFLVPCILTVLCAVGFLLFFKEDKATKPTAA